MKNLTNITVTGQDLIDFLISTYGSGNINVMEYQNGFNKFQELKNNKNKMFIRRKTDSVEITENNKKWTRILTTPIDSIYVRSLI